MHNLSLEDAHTLASTLTIREGKIACPICGRFIDASQNAEGSPFWGHFFSKSHTPYRPVDPTLAGTLRPIIVQAARAHKKAVRAQEAAAKEVHRTATIAENRRRQAKHTVSAALLDQIVDEMESLMGMMEPYYAQADADTDARALIAEIRAISGTPYDGMRSQYL